MGIELPPELADVAAQAGVVWPEADEEAMARQAQAWRDTATSMSTLATDADTTARAALTSVAGDAGDAAAREWKTFVEADSGHLTSVVRDANAAADRLEHAADQVGAAKVEIVRNLVSLAQNADAAHAAASAGHPTALAGLDTAVRGTAANVAHIESQLVSAVQPGSGVDMAAVQNPVNANPGHHLLAGVTTTVADVTSPVTDAVVSTVDQTVDTATQLPGDVARPAAGLVGDTADTLRPTPGNLVPGDVVPDRPGGVLPGDGSGVLPGRPTDLLPGDDPGVLPGHPGDAVPGRPGDAVPVPADPDVTGPVPSDTIDDTPTPPTGQTVQAGFAGGLEPAAAAPPPNLPPAAAAPPLASPAAPPAYGGGPYAGAPAAPVGGAPAAPVPAPGRPAAPIPAAPAPAAPAPIAPAPVRSAPAAYTPPAAPADPAPRASKPMAGPPGAPPPAKGERNEVLAAFWIHMFPIGHLPVASYRPARQVAAPPPEMDYAAGLRFEPADHPDFRLVDDRPRLAELHEGIAHRAATKAAEEAAPAQLPPPSTPPGYQSYAPPSAYQYPAQAPGYPPPAYPAQQVGGGMSYTGLGQPGYPPAGEVPNQAQPAEPPSADVSPDAATLPRFRPVNPSAGITADHPTVQALLEDHDPLGGANERDWDRRYLVRLGSVTPQGISPEGLEYNWPTSEQYPEGGSAPGEPETLAEDTVIDRFGTPHGRVFAADSTKFAQRSLPPSYKDAGYRRYRVLRPLPVWRAVSAAWFRQPGGGVRYRTTHSAIELVALGYLEEIA